MVDRRNFLKSLAAITSSTVISPTISQGETVISDKWGDLLPQRRLGKTGESVTMLGTGGAHIGLFKQHAQQLIETSIEGGIRFFDTASHYSDGESERLYGKYLVPNYREEVFILTKAHTHTKKDVLNLLDKSLLRMNTDYIDLWLMHQVMSVEDAEYRINHGVLDAFIEAKESGKVKHIGFSGHRDPAANLRVIEETDIFEVCQMPISCADVSYGSFINRVLPVLLKRDIGVAAMKTLAAGGFFGGSTWFRGGDKPKICPDIMSVRDAIHFAWSMPVSVLITGANDPDMLQEKIDLAKSFSKLDVEKITTLIDSVVHLTDKASVEDRKSVV